MTNSKQPLCNNCNDAKKYHPINLCYNYEPKLRKVEKKIVKPLSWSNYFKSYFVELKPEIEIIDEPVYYDKYKFNVSDYDSGKTYASVNYTKHTKREYPVDGNVDTNTLLQHYAPTIPFSLFGAVGNSTSTSDTVKVNWLNNIGYKFKYIMNGMWIDMLIYVVNVFKPKKYITENEMKQMKDEIENEM